MANLIGKFSNNLVKETYISSMDIIVRGIKQKRNPTKKKNAPPASYK